MLTGIDDRFLVVVLYAARREDGTERRGWHLVYKRDGQPYRFIQRTRHADGDWSELREAGFDNVHIVGPYEVTATHYDWLCTTGGI